MLTRREGERILIGDEIVVSVERIGVERVAIGITAPRDIVIDRPEVRQDIKSKGRRQKPKP